MSIENPNWFDRNDRETYDNLFYRRPANQKLTESEQRFITTMYHYEEFEAGLDGD